MTTMQYAEALNEVVNNGNIVPIGETVWHNSKDRGLYVGTKRTGFKEEPTWAKKIADGSLFNKIQDDLDKQQKGLGAGVYKQDDIYKALDKSVHDVFNVYSQYYAPELEKGKKYSDITADLKHRGLGAATLSGQTFATLRNTSTQFRVIRYLERTQHILKDLVSTITVTSLDPVKFGSFEGSDSIKEKVGEFETPTTGLGKYTEHQFTIDKYIGGFNVAPEFFMYDYGQYDIIGDHLRDQVGEIDVIRNKRVYEIMTGAGVTAVPAAGSWSLLAATGFNVNNPTVDLRPIIYTMNTSGRGSKANFIAMNANLLTTYETNTYIGPNPNPNDTGRAVQPTTVAEDNVILPAGSLVGLRNLRVGVDSMLTDVNGVVVGSSDAIVFAEGPSSSRSFVDQRSEVLMRQNKWWFGAYLYDANLIKRITGAA